MPTPRMLNCPVCGKQPKIKYNHIPTGCFVKIQCKPFFGKAHLEVEHGAALEERALQMATDDWNNEVEIVESNQLFNKNTENRTCDNHNHTMRHKIAWCLIWLLQIVWAACSLFFVSMLFWKE